METRHRNHMNISIYQCYDLSLHEVSLLSSELLVRALENQLEFKCSYDEDGNFVVGDLTPDDYQDGFVYIVFSEKTLIYCASEFCLRFINNEIFNQSNYRYLYIVCDNILMDFGKKMLPETGIKKEWVANQICLSTKIEQIAFGIHNRSYPRIYSNFSRFSKTRLMDVISNNNLPIVITGANVRKGCTGWKTVLYYDSINCYDEISKLAECEFKESVIYSYHLNHYRKRQINPGYVYLIKAKGLKKTYKIGRSKHSKKRFKQISLKLPFKTKLFYSKQVGDCVKVEKHFHKKFSDKRTNGEWFRLSRKNIDYIMNYKEPQF